MQASDACFCSQRSQCGIRDFYGAGREDNSRSKAFEFTNGEPPVLLGNNEGANPVEFLLHALAGCVTTTVALHAMARGISIRELSMVLEATLTYRDCSASMMPCHQDTNRSASSACTSKQIVRMRNSTTSCPTRRCTRLCAVLSAAPVPMKIERVTSWPKAHRSPPPLRRAGRSLFRLSVHSRHSVHLWHADDLAEQGVLLKRRGRSLLLRERSLFA
jgi:organic hydroperoxide reductase OsmC/OhrA